ncbi:hypothetical protein ACLOAV_003647 [Pseudogymnoascus australis]
MATTKFSSAFFREAKAEIESLNLHHKIVDGLVSVLQLEQNHFHHQTSYSDGEIYLKIVEATTFGLDKNVQIWKARLSHCKVTGVDSLLRHEEISGAFNELRDFPGLWKGLELGNIEKLLALHMDEEIIHYLRHIKSVWDKITLGKDALKRAVCPETVQFLSLRAPAASKADRISIVQEMRHGTIFQSVPENDKRAITRTLLNLTVIIPTIKTLHENQKLVRIGVKILKDTILGTTLRTTVRHALEKKWTRPRDMRIEINEGQFFSLPKLRRSVQWKLTYQQIWLFILREFPGLSGEAPKLDSRKAGVPQSCCVRNSTTQQKFCQFTANLGIFKSKINTEASAKCTHPARAHLSATASSVDGVIQKKRCGKPFRSSYMRYKANLYLSILAKTPTFSSNELPTSTYVLRDFMLSFFGPTSISVRTNEKPLEHSIFISDEDTLSESIASPRVSSDDDDVEESVDLHTPIDDDDLLPHFDNEEQLEDEVASNNEIETSRRRSPLQSSSFAEVTHKISPIFQQMLESQPDNALSDAPRSPTPPIAIQGDLSPQLLNAEYQYIGVSGVEDEAEVPMMSGALVKNSQPVYVVGTDSDGDHIMTANTQLALGESLEHNSQLHSYRTSGLLPNRERPRSPISRGLLVDTLSDGFRNSINESQALMITEGQPSQNNSWPILPSASQDNSQLILPSGPLPNRERARSPVLQGALDFINSVNQPEVLGITEGPPTQPTEIAMLDGQVSVNQPDVLMIAEGQPSQNSSQNSSQLILSSGLLPNRERARSPILQGAADFINSVNQPEVLRITEGQPTQPESLDDSRLILSATEIDMLDRPVTVISDLLPDRERARSPIPQGALDFSNKFNQPEALIILGRQSTQQEVLDDSQPIPLIGMLPEGQPTQPESLMNSQLLEMLNRPPSPVIELLPSRERARSPILHDALAGSVRDETSNTFNQLRELRPQKTGNAGLMGLRYKQPKIIHTLQKRFLGKPNRNVSQHDQNMSGISNENRHAVVINNSLMQPFESAAINSHGASPLPPSLVETSHYQANAELNPESRVAVKWPISIFEYNGNQLKQRTILNPTMLKEYLRIRVSGWVMFGGRSIPQKFIFKPRDRLMIIRQKEGWKFTFVREQHKILWMDTGRQLMEKRLGHDSARVPVRVQSVPQGDPARALQPAGKLPTTQDLDETYPTATFQVHGKEDLFTASGSKDANRASPEAAQQAQQEAAQQAQKAQREQEAAQKAQQEQVVTETFNQIQGEEDLFEAEDRVSLASEVENGQARTETVADTSHIQNHSDIETGQARTENLAESELLEDGKSLSLATRVEDNQANTASLSKLVVQDPLSKEEMERQKDIKAFQTAQTSGGQTGAAQIGDNYVAKSQSTLPIPHVFDKSHLAKIKQCNEEDRKFWTIQYGAALSFQKTQGKILQTLDTEEMERQKDISAFQTAPEQLLNGSTKSARELRLQFKEQGARLEDVNNAIALTNLAADRDEFFGQVHTHSLVEPKLNNQDDFKSIVTQNPKLQSLLAEPYYKASQLQHYHRNYMKVTKEGTHNKSIETRILHKLIEINDDIDIFVRQVFKEAVVADRKREEEELKRSQNGKISQKQKKGLDHKYKLAEEKIKTACLVYVPNEGEDDYTLGEEKDDDGSDSESLMQGISDKPHIEERGDGVGGQSQKKPLPKEVYGIRSRMGGRDGPLFALIDAKLQGKEDDAAAYLLKSLAGEVEKFCDAKGINRATYALTDTHINAFYGMVEEVNGSLVLLKANINDTHAHHQYKQLRSRADLFVQEHQWPETFLDTFVPTEAEISKWVNDEIKREAAQKAQKEQEAAQKAQQEIEAARTSTLQEGQLSARKQTDLLDKGQENHQAHSSNIQERAERPALPENYTTQDNYTTEGNAEEPASDQAQTALKAQE